MFFTDDEIRIEFKYGTTSLIAWDGATQLPLITEDNHISVEGQLNSRQLQMLLYLIEKKEKDGNGDMTYVPILQDFDDRLLIGELKIRTSALPKTPDFVFSLAYIAEDMSDRDQVTLKSCYRGRYTLISISPNSHHSYIRYLKQVGEIKV